VDEAALRARVRPVSGPLALGLAAGARQVLLRDWLAHRASATREPIISGSFAGR